MRLLSTQLYIKEGPLEDSVLVSSWFTYESIYYGHYDDNETDMYLMLMLTVLASKTVEVLGAQLVHLPGSTRSAWRASTRPLHPPTQLPKATPFPHVLRTNYDQVHLRRVS